MISLKTIHEKYEKIIIWGAGNTFKNFFSGNMKIDYIVDSDSKKWGNIVENDIIIKSPEVLISENPSKTVIIICSIYWRDIIKEIKDEFDVYLDIMIQPNPFQKGIMYKSGFSLFAEDAMIKGIAERYHVDILHYIDVGANHPYFGNASILFYLNGATGCLVEPNFKFYLVLKESRPYDIIINKGVSNIANHGKNMIYYDVDNIDTINTFSRDRAEEYKEKGFEVEEKYIEMVCLNSILEEYSKKVNYISIDVEGGEFEILKDFDFYKYNVEIFNIEKGDDRCNRLLMDNGYEKVGETPSNLIFIRKGIIS